jgi:hypothetical protein
MQQRAEFKDVWMKKKYCRLVKTKLYRSLCDMDHDEQYVVERYNYDLKYILQLADADGYNLSDLPELFLDEWETLFNASPVSKWLTDKMVINALDNGTYKNNQDEEALSEREEHVPGIQVSDQSEGLRE